MAFRVVLLLAMLALAWVAESVPSDISVHTWSLPHLARKDLDPSSPTCNGLVGDCIDEEQELLMDSEINRRGLREANRFISYGALQKNRVPCNRRGASYYNCRPRGRVNPYRRGCSAITRCKRYAK
ncbi:rapid alkalinization factor-like [Aristolochia californica]|uniref:rapid alkalinization factor-like n=1 Tax=Aristolochia californica TaxID=171875 RepID=UPI0035E2863A